MMNSIFLLPLFVAAATAASLYSRSPASTYLINYPMAYPTNYPVDPTFKHDAEMRQGLPLPTLLAQQAVLALANWQVRNTIAFWNLMNCVVDASCPAVNTSPATGPTRIQALFQQIFNNQQGSEQQTMFQTLAQQIGSLLPNQIVQEDVVRNIHALAYQYPEYFAGQFA